MIPSPDGMRVEPVAGPRSYQTFQVASPLETHWRPATCEEIDCQAYLFGWQTTVDERIELGQRQAHHIRHDNTRRYTEVRVFALTVFAFEPGQRCFGSGQHRVRERPEIFIKKDGDWRGNPTGRKHILGSQDWVDDFGEQLGKLKDQHEKG